MGLLSILNPLETTSLPEITNPLLDENGNLISTDEAVSHFTKLWEQWDPINKMINALPKVIFAVIILVAGFFLASLISKIVIRTLKAKNVDPSIYQFIKSIISVIIKIVFILFALSLFVNINSFLAAIGAVGLTAGIGLQDSVAQFASGIQILLNRQFNTGDYIAVDGQEGFVVEIRFMNTVITTVDNKRVIIPNSHITKSNIVNYSAEENRRVDLVFSISYSDDIAKAKAVILDVANNNESILKDPAAVVYVNSHESSSINLVARFWCKSAEYWNVYFSMQENVKLAFDKNDINIPFNQLDVHIIDKK